MTWTDRMREADRIFCRALDLPEEERAPYLAEACGGDEELRRLVGRLMGEGGTEVMELTPGGLQSGAFWSSLVEDLGVEPEAAAGTLVGNYRILREHGRGGMAVVYLAERADGQFEQKVAVKRIQQGIATEEGIRRFEQERRMLALAQHPHIAQLLDGGVDERGRPYLVTEFVDGRQIDRYADEERLDLRQRLELFLQVARAVDSAHRNLILHRDLKPSNILVSEEGYVKLLDFGIGKLLGEGGEAGEDPGLTRTDAVVMTPVFASPEQLRGEKLTTASDVYQLGLLLFLLLSGRWPYRLGGGTPGEVIRATCDEEPTRPSSALVRTGEYPPPIDGLPEGPDEIGRARDASPAELRRLLAGDLDTIALMALRKEPERRYRSVAQLIDDVEAYLEGRPVAARPDTFLYRAGKLAGRNKAAVATAAAAIALLVGAAFFYTLNVTRARDAAEAEAAKATEVSTFLKSLFQVSAPTRSRGERITAREMLDRGARRIAEELSGQPALQAEMMTLMGDIYRELAHYEEARPLLVRARELREGLQGEARLALAETLYALGQVLEEEGEHGAALAAYGEALAIREAVHGREHPEVARALGGLGRVRILTGEFGEAEKLFGEALLVLEAGGEDGPEVGRALMGLGEALKETGELAAARPRLERALEVFQRSHEGDHPEIAETRILLGHVLRFSGDAEGARVQYETALPLLERVYGPEHPKVANALNRLALLLHSEEDFDGAVARHLRALEIRRKALGSDHALVAQSLNNLGRSYWREGDLDGARRTFEEALVVYEKALGPEHVDLARALQNLASVLEELGQLEQAVRLHERVVAIRERALGPEHPHLAIPLLSLALLQLELGNARAGELLARRALEVGRPEPAFRQAEVLWPRLALGRCLLGLGRLAEAERLLLENLQEEKIYPRIRRQTLTALVELYEARDRPEEAVRYRQALAVSQDG